MKITRQELYDLVWSKPISHLAREFNLSNVGLSKICERHQIPRPPAGYWLRPARGHVGNREPLPSSKGEVSDVIEIEDKKPSSEAELAGEFPELAKEYDRIRSVERKIDVSRDVKNLHPLLRKTEASLRKAIPERYGRLECRSGCVDISVSKKLIDRSLLIMDALLRDLESRGFPISVRDTGGTFVKILNEEIQISLQEKTRGVAYVPKEREFMPPKYSYETTGVLLFRIVNMYSDNVRRNWSDAESSPLEAKLSEISEGLVRAAFLSQVQRMRWEAKLLKAEAAQREEMKKKAQLQFEETRLQKLVHDAKIWETSQLLRSFVDAVAEALSDGIPDASTGSELGSWIGWARQQADRMDPIVNEPSKIWSTQNLRLGDR